jgi:hypothetical protein
MLLLRLRQLPKSSGAACLVTASVIQLSFQAHGGRWKEGRVVLLYYLQDSGPGVVEENSLGSVGPLFVQESCPDRLGALACRRKGDSACRGWRVVQDQQQEGLGTRHRRRLRERPGLYREELSLGDFSCGRRCGTGKALFLCPDCPDLHAAVLAGLTNCREHRERPLVYVPPCFPPHLFRKLCRLFVILKNWADGQ